MAPGRRLIAEYRLSLDGEKAVQKSHKVKRKGLLARGEQLRTEEIQAVMLLVAFELEVVILILEIEETSHRKIQVTTEGLNSHIC